MERNILTAKEVAQYLKVSQRSKYRLIREGKITATKLLNKWRFDKREIDKIFESGMEKSPYR